MNGEARNIKVQMAQAEVDAILKKYDLRLVTVEARVNGQLVAQQIVLAEMGEMGVQVRLVEKQQG